MPEKQSKTKMISDDYVKALRLASGNPESDAKAWKALEKARAKGDPRAAYAMGSWYFHGKEGVVKRNLRKAVSLFREASSQNNPDALFHLALSYELGEGVKRNLETAFRYYVQAALNGYHDSIYEVGRCYYYGVGVKKDRALAKIWYERAQANGVEA